MSGEPATSETPVDLVAATSRPALGVNVFFRLAAAFVLLFVVTIFSLIAILFGDPQAPIARWLDRYGMQLIIGELCAILVTGTLAMTVDRWQTLNGQQAVPQDGSAVE